MFVYLGGVFMFLFFQEALERLPVDCRTVFFWKGFKPYLVMFPTIVKCVFRLMAYVTCSAPMFLCNGGFHVFRPHRFAICRGFVSKSSREAKLNCISLA